MAFFRRKNRRHLIPVHRDNARSDDWLVILEANTIVSPHREALRVACATRERNLVTRLRRPWYDPRRSLPGRPLVAETMLDDYDTLLVESPPAQPLLSAPVGEEADSGLTVERAASEIPAMPGISDAGKAAASSPARRRDGRLHPTYARPISIEKIAIDQVSEAFVLAARGDG
jgi:hypothetical protein